jgi:hypothetical protein
LQTISLGEQKRLVICLRKKLQSRLKELNVHFLPYLCRS